MGESETRKSLLLHPSILFIFTIILLITICGQAIWVPYQHEQQVINEIERLGAVSRTTRTYPNWIPEFVDDEYLFMFEEIHSLHSYSHRFTDEYLRRLTNLRRMKNLKTLKLQNAQISDVCLENLARLTNLEKLHLDNTKVTESGVKNLQKALPKCSIEWTPPSK